MLIFNYLIFKLFKLQISQYVLPKATFVGEQASVRNAYSVSVIPEVGNIWPINGLAGVL